MKLLLFITAQTLKSSMFYIKVGVNNHSVTNNPNNSYESLDLV